MPCSPCGEASLEETSPAEGVARQGGGSAERSVERRRYLPLRTGLQAEAGDTADLLHGGAALLGGGILQAHLEGIEDGVAVAALDRHHEGKAELRLVGLVEAFEAGHLLRGALVEAGAGLLPGGVVGELAGQGRLAGQVRVGRSEEHTSELQSRPHLVCRLLLEKKKHITSCN